MRTLTRRTRLPLDDTWDDLRNRLPENNSRAGLSRFMSFCSADGIAPDGVTPAVFERFGQALHDDSIAPNPRQTYRTACILWNQAVAEIPGWPSVMVPVPDRSRRYAMYWEEFPAAFRQDAEAFLNRLGDQDPFSDDYAPSVRPSTVVMRRKQILQIATAAVRSGLPVEQVTSLAVLVQPDIAKQVLRFFLTARRRQVHQIPPPAGDPAEDDRAPLGQGFPRAYRRAGGLRPQPGGEEDGHDGEEPRPPASVR